MLSGDEFYDDEVTSPSDEGSGPPPTRTAIGAAEPDDVYDAIFQALDHMDGPRLREFVHRLGLRYRLTARDLDRGDR